MFDDLKSAVTWLSTAITGILLWVGKREVRRIDELKQAIETVNQRFLTKDEFNTTIAGWRQERQDMHAENKETLNRIHERVDSLWERGK